MDNFRSRHIGQADRLTNPKIPGPTLIFIICILGVSLLVGLFMGRFAGVILEKKAAVMIPLLVGGIIVAFVNGRIALLYLLAFCWFVPAVFAGLGFITITIGVTGWELLLWLLMFLTLVTGDISLLRSSTRHSKGRSLSIRWLWVGLGMVSVFSWLAIGRVVLEGAGQFRYAAINLIFLFLVMNNLVVNEKQLKNLVFWFLAGVVGLVVFQIGVGGYEFLEGRLSVNMISLTSTVIQALPNRMALLASSGIPLALCLALWNQEGRLVRTIATVIYLMLFIIVFLTVSRAQMISVSIASFIVFVLMSRLNKKNVISLFFVLSTTIFLLLNQVIPIILASSGAGAITNVIGRFLSFSNLFIGDRTLGTRLDIIKISLDLLNPFGIGYGHIAQLTGMWEHNLFLTVLNGSGILGLLGLVIFFVGYAVVAIMSIQNSKGFVWVMSVGALASIVTLAINGLSIEIIYPTYPESSLVALAIGFAAIKLAKLEK
jgi:hypothetical protein